MKIAIIGAGQFAGSFAGLWQLHPDVTSVHITDLLPERAEAMAERYGLAGTLPDADAALASDVDAIAVFTQRWLHAPLVLQALAAGKHVYSAVPMAYTAEEVAAVVAQVERSGQVYMLGETSYYNPAVVHARQRLAEGDFGRLFYAEGDYVHDMDNGFYAAYQFSGGENWKPTASYPPMQYPTHSVGGVLGAWPTHATSVSCIGVVDDRGDGVFDREVSMFDNEWSNMSAHMQLADGGVMRINEFRRVGHPSHVHESRFRFYGTDGVLEQHSASATWSNRKELLDISDLFHTRTEHVPEELREGIDPDLLHSFSSGTAKVQDRSRLPREFDGAHNGHEGAHHFLADDFVRAVTRRTQPPVNAWLAARFNLPGIVAMESARQGGTRLPVPDHGDGPEIDWAAFA
ncbi:gfo/Idh/MocA family oxidoreductase [Auraticoccus sp. F435]|uniref:Gfo/Idh/MocA family oxidoreductase n=1 Tax=Auraticoccus cholistanensis TaxID=2656650 RepID=A0A6A9V251_9ACTN|nr:gfo/Idh/MocA family oxidoreductase [Auraticoccus cholistanensis]